MSGQGQSTFAGHFRGFVQEVIENLKPQVGHPTVHIRED
jgi:hypothetical protein